MIPDHNAVSSQCVSPHRTTHKEIMRGSVMSLASVEIDKEGKLGEAQQQDLELRVQFDESHMEVHGSDPIDEEVWDNLWYDRYDLEVFEHRNHNAVDDMTVQEEDVGVLRERFQSVYDAACESEVDCVIPKLTDLVESLSEVYEQMEELEGLECHVVDSIRWEENRKRARLLDLVDEIREGKTNATPATLALTAAGETRQSQLFAWVLALAKSSIVDHSDDLAFFNSDNVPQGVRFDDRVTYYDNKVMMDEDDCKTLWYSKAELENIQHDTVKVAEKILSNKKYAKVVQKFLRLYQAFCGLDDEQDFYQSLAVVQKMKEFYEEVEEFAAVDFFVLREVREDAEDRRADLIDLVEQDYCHREKLAHMSQAVSRPFRFLARAMGLAKFTFEECAVPVAEHEVRAQHQAEQH